MKYSAAATTGSLKITFQHENNFTFYLGQNKISGLIQLWNCLNCWRTTAIILPILLDRRTVNLCILKVQQMTQSKLIE